MSQAACNQIRDDLSAYLDGELSGDRRRLIDTHLRDCAACAADLEGLRDVAAKLGALPRAPVPQDLSEAVRREFVRDALEPASKPALPTGAWIVALRVAASAALIVLAVTVTWRVTHPQADHAPGSSLGFKALGLEPAKEENGIAALVERTDTEFDAALGIVSRPPVPAAAAARGRVANTPVGGGAFDLNATTVELVLAPETEAELNQTIEILQGAANEYALAVEGRELGPPVRAQFAKLQTIDFQNSFEGGDGEIEVIVAHGQVWNLIGALDDNAAQSVTVAMSFRGSDAILLQAAGSRPDVRRIAGGLEAGEPRGSLEDALRDGEELESAVRAGHMATDRDALKPSAPPKPDSLQGAGRGGRRSRSLGQPSPALRERSNRAKAGVRSEDAREDRSKVGPARAADDPVKDLARKTTGPTPTLAARLRRPTTAPLNKITSGKKELDERDAEPDTDEKQVALKRGLLAERKSSAAARPAPVRFRVRIVPPPASSTTQSATSKPSQP